jgi:hypothetical protein
VGRKAGLDAVEEKKYFALPGINKSTNNTEKYIQLTRE